MKKPIPFGKYYLLDRISVGGMAEVFKAKAFGVEGFERLIAVKRILPSIAEDEEFITMFIDEAKIAVQLQHANIAQIFDLGKVGESYFIALEYVQGKDMRSIVDRMRKHKVPMPISMAVYCIMKVCEGLDYAHNKKDPAGRELNLVHRDVSPQNILISYDGEVKIIDFGIAKAAGKAGKTQAGILKGKFGYMSPEQVRGLPLDRRSDIFAVGICLWEMLTGERLFVGESDFSTLEKVRNVEITPPSTYNKELPPELESIVLKTLSKEVENRYQSAMDLHDDLQRWMYDSGSFFARKELAQFMNEIFHEDIEKESEVFGGASGILRSSVPPPNQGVSLAPPPPPPKGTPSGDSASHRSNTPPPAVLLRSTPPPVPRLEAPTPLPRPTPSPAPIVPAAHRIPQPIAPKRTALGVPAPVLKPSVPPMAGNPTRSLSTPVSKQSDILPPTPAQKAPTLDADIGLDDWDDDEPPTNIYSKEAAKEMAKASLAMKATQEVPMPRGMPAPPDFDSEPIVSEDITGRRWLLPTLTGLAVAFLVLVGVAIYFMTQEKTGTVELFVEPAGLKSLEVVVDGVDRLDSNMSPFKKTIEVGEHTFTIKHAGYKDKRFNIAIKKGDKIKRNIVLERTSTGFFLETDPPGANVFVNDRPYAEKTPVTVDDLDPGTYTIRIAKGENYVSKTIEVDVEAGKIAQLPPKKLDLKTVEVTFKTQPWEAEAVLIDMDNNLRKTLGETPVTEQVDTSKNYKIQFSKDGYERDVKPLVLPPGEAKVTISTDLKRVGGSRTVRPPTQRTGNGYLSVQTKPWSRVSIDNTFVRNTPLVNHSLRPGKYTVTVENPQFNIRRNFRVTIRSGKTTTLVRNLL